jgi:hypothetical protein
LMEAVENLKQDGNIYSSTRTNTCHWHGALYGSTELDCVAFIPISTTRCLCNMSLYKCCMLSHYNWSLSSHHKMCTVNILLFYIFLKVNLNKDIHSSKHLSSCNDISLALISNPNFTLPPYS